MKMKVFKKTENEEWFILNDNDWIMCNTEKIKEECYGYEFGKCEYYDSNTSPLPADIRYSYNPYKTTYNASYLPNRINSDTLVGNNKYLGTGVAYNSKKKKIEFLKSNIFCDRDKYNQNSNLKDNFDPKSINHNNWYTNLDWRNNKSELIFYKDNQKEFYDNNSKGNPNYFELYK